MKRLFDFIFALIGLFLSLPFWVIFGLLIWLEDGGPVFYVQKRIGEKGKVFNMFKFRSMVPDAEKRVGVVRAKEKDPRITTIGKILRATAMDELPQLVSILKGDMSFVGPRAERPELVAKIVQDFPDFKLRLRIIPGLTGPAQIFGRYDSSPQDKLKYDLWYMKRQNFFLDLQLIVLSLIITFAGKWQIRGNKFSFLARRLKEKISQDRE